ncbi:hypothetical protein BLNAU_20271 [Blattamonas nauphoetae]|uniref:Uncharacterized protein n=1 Tax=Blattamonas nauphoetae TaxID=2049346 RepID=A0ABQ9WZ62_9EUKA|nr:hypothetical protein BLNAU_20271 [Blattamonas nauphoetae]
MIGLDSRLKHRPCQSSLTADDVMIDDTGTIRINPSQLSPPSPLPTVTPSFSVDVGTFFDLFGTILEKLHDSSLLFMPPLELIQERIKNIVISLLNSFVQSKDITPNVFPDQFPHLVTNAISWDMIRNIDGDTFTDTCWTLFCLILAEVDPLCGQLRPSAIFDEDGSPSEHSNRIADSSDKLFQESTHTELNVEVTFFENVLDLISNPPQNMTDISILRDPGFKETLVRLQSKYQKRIIPKTDPLHSVQSSQDDVLLSTTMDDQINSPFKQTPEGESITTQEVRSEFGSLHPSTQISVRFDDSHSASVDSDQSTSDSLTLQTELPPSEDTDPLLIEPASTTNHSLPTRLPSVTESDEAMAMLKLLHSLIVAPPITHAVTNPAPPPQLFYLHLFKEHENFDVNERFSVSLFDEDDESLVKALRRCSDVCELVPPDHCIDDMPSFVDNLVSSLTSNNSSITRIASDILTTLLQKCLDFNDFLQKHWKDLRTAFRDGSPGARNTLLCVIALWVSNYQDIQSKNSHFYRDFDLDGLVAADTDSFMSFPLAIHNLIVMKSQYSGSYTHNYFNSLFQSFETKHQASDRIWRYIIDGTVSQYMEFISTLIKFCLELSLLVGLKLQPDLFDYILNFPGLHTVFVTTDYHTSFILSHTSINLSFHQQQAFLVQLLFERTLRSDPSAFFVVYDSQEEDLSSEHILTPFVGLHSLFLRGFHLQPMFLDKRSIMISIHHFGADSGGFLSDQFRLYYLFPPPLILQFFSSLTIQLPPFDLSGMILYDILLTFIGTCAPFGECRTFLSLVKSLLASLPNIEHKEAKDDVNMLLDTIIRLHWFSLPLSFRSPFLLIPHLLSHTPGIAKTIDLWSSEPDYKLSLAIFNGSVGFSHLIEGYAVLAASVFSRRHTMKTISSYLLSPIPSVVSLVLVFLARTVHLCDEAGKMEMVQLGVIDYVIVAVSQSSFLEDFETGIALIGELLRTVRQDEQNSEIGSMMGKTHFSVKLDPSSIETCQICSSRHPFDNTLQDRAAIFLKSLEPKWNDDDQADILVTDLVPSSAEALSGFVDSILTLLSSPHSTVAAAALSFLNGTTAKSSPAILTNLVEADLVSNVLATVQPHTLPISENERSIILLIEIINTFVCDLGITAAVDTFNHREMILQKVVIPSSQFVTFLISNRNVLRGDLFRPFLSVLHTLIETSPFHRPTLEFVLRSPIVVAYLRSLSSIEQSNNLWYSLHLLNFSLEEWKTEDPEVSESVKRMMQALISEDFEDTLEQMLMHNKSEDYDYGVVNKCHSISQWLGWNVKFTED